MAARNSMCQLVNNAITVATPAAASAGEPGPDARRLLGLIATRRPHIHCLTNTVAQNLTANVLLAIGAHVSMTLHPAELEAMLSGASAVLVNLGTMDLAREVAIEGVLGLNTTLKMPIVIDPVFADLSPLRLNLAVKLLQLPSVILKGNAREMAALSTLCAPHVTRITTGAIDEVAGQNSAQHIDDGHPIMARVTGTGCAAGAFIAAFAAVENDFALASAAAMSCYNLAGRMAASKADGPGSFTAHFIDALARMSDKAAEMVA